MPRYSVPGDLEITNKEKKNYNGCNGLLIAGSEHALKWDTWRLHDVHMHGVVLISTFNQIVFHEQ